MSQTDPDDSPLSPRLAGLDAQGLLREGLSALKGPRGLLPWEAPSPESLALLLPDYQVHRLVGRGAMGAVYEARQKRLDRRVALKLLPDELALDPEFTCRFLAEGRVLARMLHPRIVTVFDSSESLSGSLFLVMEFVDGETLGARMRRGRPDVSVVVDWLRQISEALAFAHELGVVHRDLKPGNILLNSRGGVKVADFGLSGLLSGGDSASGDDCSSPSGTPGYSAPEQLLGHANSGPRADVFSLGVIGYELLTGRRPGQPPLPPSQVTGIDPRLDAPVLRALHPDPAERHADAAAFLADVQQAWESIANQEKTRRQLRRTRALAAAFAAISIAALGAGALAWRQSHLAGERALVIAERERSERRMSAETDSDLAHEFASRAMEEWPRAVAHLARALRTNPDNRIAASRLVDLLTSQPWLLPVTPPMEHNAPVRWAEYNSDGSRIASASDDNTARVWDAKTGRPLTPPLMHGGVVHRASFSPDGTRLLTISGDGFARIWNPDAPEKPEIEVDCGSPVLCGQWTPDGTKIVGGCENGTLRVWHASSGEPFTSWMQHDAAVLALAVSATGREVAVDVGLNASVQPQRGLSAWVWNISAETPRNIFKTPSARSLPVQFSPDGARLLTGPDRCVRLVESLAGTSIFQRGFARIDKTEDHQVTVAAFSPDSHGVLMGSNFGIVNIWDPDRANWAGPDLRHEGAVTALAFNPDGYRVAAGTERGIVKLWAKWDGAPRSAPLLLYNYCLQVRFSPDGLRLLTACGNGRVQQWDASAGPALSRSFLHPQRSVLAASFSPDGQLLATSCTSGHGADVLTLWPCNGDKPAASLLAGDKLWNVSFRQDGQHLAVARRVHPAVVYDAKTLELVAELTHPLPTNWADYSPSGRQVVVAHQNGLAQIWEMGPPVTKGLSIAMPGNVNSAKYSPDGKRIVTASTDSQARIWDSRTGLQILALSHQTCVQYAEYSRDGRYILTASEDGAARIWSAETGQMAVNPMLHNGSVLCAAFSPDGTKVITGSNDNYARLWDAQTGKLLRQPEWHANAVTSVCFSPNGQYFVTTDGRSAARMHHLQPCETVPEWFCDFAESVGGARLDDTGRTVPALGDASRMRDQRLADTSENRYSRIARWFFQRGGSRPIAPGDSITVRDYVRDLLSLDHIDAPEQAFLAQPSDPQVIACLRLWNLRGNPDLRAWLRTYPAALPEASQHPEWWPEGAAPGPVNLTKFHTRIADEWKRIADAISKVRDVKADPKHAEPGYQDAADAAEKSEPRKREAEHRKLAAEPAPKGAAPR